MPWAADDAVLDRALPQGTSMVGANAGKRADVTVDVAQGEEIVAVDDLYQSAIRQLTEGGQFLESQC